MRLRRPGASLLSGPTILRALLRRAIKASFGVSSEPRLGRSSVPDIKHIVIYYNSAYGCWPRRGRIGPIPSRRSDKESQQGRRRHVRITSIETLRTDEFANVLWVRVHTDAGLIGLGETFYGASAIEAQIHDTFAGRLLGGR